jgi:hypothetical protein
MTVLSVISQASVNKKYKFFFTQCPLSIVKKGHEGHDIMTLTQFFKMSANIGY